MSMQQVQQTPQMRTPETPWPPGTEVIAVYSFKGGNGDDLPFSRRDVLSIVKSTRDPNWYYAKNKDGKEGMIPVNYVLKRGEVKLNVMPWFHGKIGRGEAENLLIPKENGLFLVRESTNFPGDYTLCVCLGQKVEHYHIIYKNDKLSIDEEEYFENLIELVEHYEDDADGLCTRLTKPLMKIGDMAVTVTKKDFIEQGWVIRRKDLDLGEKLGKGQFGDVFKGKYYGKDVAVKTLKDSSTAAQQFLAEASVMTALRHKNLVQLIGVVLGETIHIITEFLEKGSLVDYLRSRGRSLITKKDQIKFASDTCCGMTYLESKKLVHRDLAARNVLIAADNSAKVSDFGLAKHQDALQHGGLVPIKWTAPEALRDGKFTSKSDMWSFGILLWEVYSYGRVPYPRIPLSDVVMHVERGYRMDCPEGCPSEVYDIMKSAWTLDAVKRPTFPEVMAKLDNMRSATA